MKNDDTSIENKLSKVKYSADDKSHLELNQEICKNCKNKVCLFVCPARVYRENEDGTIKIEYENCLECKACKVACEHGAIKWNYPSAKMGVLYKFS